MMLMKVVVLDLNIVGWNNKLVGVDVVAVDVVHDGIDIADKLADNVVAVFDRLADNYSDNLELHVQAVLENCQTDYLLHYVCQI